MRINFEGQSAIQSANNPVSKCQNGTLKFFHFLLCFVYYIIKHKRKH